MHEIQHQWSEEVTVAQRAAGAHVDRRPVPVRRRRPSADAGPGSAGSRLDNQLEPRRSTRTRGAAFGQATLDLTERVSATAGLRYTRERKTIVNRGRLFTLDTPVSLVPGSTYAYTDAHLPHRVDTETRGRRAAAGRARLVYVSATRGFKSGGFNLTSREAGRGYAPEWAWSYEGGLKTAVARGRARVNVAAFHMDYTDLQVQTRDSPRRDRHFERGDGDHPRCRVGRRGAARVGRARPEDTWPGSTRTYDRYIAVGVGGVTGDVAGRRLNNAPEWSGRLWLEWTRSLLGDGPALSLRADSRWQSTVFFTPFNDAIQRQRPYGLLDVSAELRAPERGRWSLGGVCAQPHQRGLHHRRFQFTHRRPSAAGPAIRARWASSSRSAGRSRCRRSSTSACRSLTFLLLAAVGLDLTWRGLRSPAAPAGRWCSPVSSAQFSSCHRSPSP